MRLKRVLFENVCQFPTLDHTFHPGLTGIIGPNGSGKSNLTKGIFFALTGLFRNQGVKADNICQLAVGKRSAVSLWLEHAGIELEIVRGLANCRTRLRIAGEPEYVLGDNAVTEKLMEILGVDVRLLGEYVFILQLHMADFIDATPADRAKVFQRLFGTDECEVVHKFINTVIDKELTADEPADLAGVRARVQASGARMGDLLDRLERLDAEIAAGTAGEALARQTIADAERADYYTHLLGQLTRELGRVRVEAEAVVARAASARTELQAMETALLQVAGDAHLASRLLAVWKAVEAFRRRVEWTARKRERLEREREKSIRPEVVAQLTEAELIELARLQTELIHAQRRLELVRSGRDECPTCGQPLARLASAPELQRQTDDARARIAGLQWRADAHHASVDALRCWDTWYERWVADWADMVAEEAALAMEAEAPPDVDPAVLQGTVDEEKGLKTALAEARDRADELDREAARLQGQWDQLQVRQRELAAEGRKVMVGQDQFREAHEAIAHFDLLRADRQRAEGEADELSRSLVADEAALARLAEAERRYAAVRALKAGARQVMDVTHRNAAPRLVSEAHLERLIDDIDEYLDLFGSDFLVRLGEGLVFVADFIDGRFQAGGRLSDGQKGVLALAFWVAVNSVFAEQLGFLSLDEPTTSLDQHNLGALQAALRKLAELSESVGLQCLLVTHEQSLAGLFDDVLQL